MTTTVGTEVEVSPLLRRIQRRATDPAPSLRSRANDQRGGYRKPSDLPGYIWVERLQSAVRCSIRDLSATGAMLKLETGKDMPLVDDLPARFVLVLTQYRERTEVDCAVARHVDGGIGVRFTGQFRTSPVANRVAAGAGKHR